MNGLPREKGLDVVCGARRYHRRAAEGRVAVGGEIQLISAFRQVRGEENAIGVGESGGERRAAEWFDDRDAGIGQRRIARGEIGVLIGRVNAQRAVRIRNGSERERNQEPGATAVNGKRAGIGAEGQVGGGCQDQGHEIRVARAERRQRIRRGHRKPRHRRHVDGERAGGGAAQVETITCEPRSMVAAS